MKRDQGPRTDSLSTEQAVLKTMETCEGRENAYLCYYEWDVSSAYRRFLQSEEWDAVKVLLSKYPAPSRKALDLGAGNGIGSYALSQSGYSVTSLEPDPSGLVGVGALRKHLGHEHLSIVPVRGFGEHLPFKDEAFGLVYVRQTLHHSVDLGSMVKEIARVLVQGGILVATREHVIDDNESLRLFLANHALHKYTHGECAFRLTDYLYALEASGLKLERLLLSWDSVINHYPTSDAMVRTKFRKTLRARFGPLAGWLANMPQLEYAFRHIRSKTDRRPGRMISFIARAA